MNETDSEARRDTEAHRRQRKQRRADRLRLLASGPPSPCISVCQMDDATGWCLGCKRTIDEIREWMIMPPEERQRVLDALKDRQ
ncbi:MAG TPA: DUF1289 domain-containing protein [Steroidobacteraceae bacterium]